jgi:peptidoglycan hydrolase-like protein with peptidoglycan-binding domain
VQLMSARFRGSQTLQDCADGIRSAYLRFGSQGDAVLLLQEALIDLGYDIPDGPTGNFLSQTSAAVVKFKTDETLVPNDPVAGQGTVTRLDGKWALPFADRDEWLSWQTRPIPEWNFTRNSELSRLRGGGVFSFSVESAWFPQPYRDALLTGIIGLLNPNGSPSGPQTPSATWGASPLDLYHCHLVVDVSSSSTTFSWSSLRTRADALGRRIQALERQAEQSGPEGSPSWARAYRQLLLAPGSGGSRGVLEEATAIFNDIHANSVNEQQPLRFVWHTFESGLWRPVDVGSDDPRRSWWNMIAPTPGQITVTPFATSQFGANVFHLFEPNFVIDQNGVITAMVETISEVCAIVGLDKRRVDAALAGTTFP